MSRKRSAGWARRYGRRWLRYYRLYPCQARESARDVGIHGWRSWADRERYGDAN